MWKAITVLSEKKANPSPLHLLCLIYDIVDVVSLNKILRGEYSILMSLHTLPGLLFGKFHEYSFLPCLWYSIFFPNCVEKFNECICTNAGSTFSTSAVIMSCVWCSVSSVGLMAISTCSCVIRPRFITSCFPVACILEATSGSSLFKISRKYSAHLLRCSVSLVRVFQFLSFTTVGLVVCKIIGDFVEGPCVAPICCRL